MGADSGIHIFTETRIDQDLQPLAVAKVFQKIVQDKGFSQIYLGKQSIDDDFNQTGQILAALLDIPCGSFCSKVEITDKEAVVTREVDFGLQKIST